MERSRAKVYGIALLLIAGGLGVMAYKAAYLGFPLFPGASQDVWTLESKITFEPTGDPVDTRLTLPEPLAGWELLDEYFASSGLTFATTETDGRRVARWTRRELDEAPTLYYKLQLTRAEQRGLPARMPRPRPQPVIANDIRTAMSRLLDSVDEQAATPTQFVSMLLRELAREEPLQEVAYLLGERGDDPVELILDLLALRQIPASRLRGLYLEDGRRRQQVTDLVEAYTDQGWQVFSPQDGRVGLPENFFVWVRGDAPMLDVVGGRDSRLYLAMVRNTLPVKTVLAMDPANVERPLLDFSIYSLPVEQQGVFKSILLIPVGALVVVLLRIVVGVSTAGTFMPILIALAFIQTTLQAGLPIFLLVIAVGLWIRSYLSQLNLLLVARISAVIIVVVLIMAAISVLSYRVGVEQALSVTLFPTIILSWTIERMSVLWEEEGPREVANQLAGSMLVAVLAYLLMINRYVAHVSFNFPEALIALLGVILLIGQYRGYRLTELYRFRHVKRL